jgi:hypothetical protein
MKRPKRPQIAQRSKADWRRGCSPSRSRQSKATRQPRRETLKLSGTPAFSDLRGHVEILPGEVSATEDVSVTRLCAQRFRYAR